MCIYAAVQGEKLALSLVYVCVSYSSINQVLMMHKLNALYAGLYVRRAAARQCLQQACVITVFFFDDFKRLTHRLFGQKLLRERERGAESRGDQRYYAWKNSSFHAVALARILV